MRGRIAIFLTVFVVLLLLVVLNAASYVRVEREPDVEYRPNRSTTNAGATGTRALHDFLQQSGHKVMRWTRPPSALLNAGAERPTTFVVVGQVRVPYRSEEARAVVRWVAAGGHLVLIDRSPDTALIPTSGGWRVSSEIFDYPDMASRPDELEKMTAGVRPVAPAQPTGLMSDVDTVLPSRYAGRLHVYQTSDGEEEDGPAAEAESAVSVFGVGDEDAAETGDEQPPPPPRPANTPAVVGAEGAGDSAAPTVNPPRAPVRHLPDWRAGDGALLVDYAHGRGRVTVLSDPYVVANSGIKNADNLQLAVNVVASGGGLIAFDEFHQGLSGGAAASGPLSLFRGTPVLWIFAQAAVVTIALLWSRGRRFARPLPAPHEDRRSKLEFVASMAELQQRARAHDLALENVYARTRRALARYAGLEATAPAAEVAARTAARSGKYAAAVESLLAECEDVVAGGRTTARRSLALARQLRELERDLGIRMRQREIRQREMRG